MFLRVHNRKNKSKKTQSIYSSLGWAYIAIIRCDILLFYLLLHRISSLYKTFFNKVNLFLSSLIFFQTYYLIRYCEI